MVLEAMARDFGTDKVDHGYMPHYETHFAPLRPYIHSVLEIGIGGYNHEHGYGHSLKLWEAYFPHAEIIGLDLRPKVVEGQRITTIEGDQTSAEDLRLIARQYGPFNIVIDDGSHRSADQIFSCEQLLPHMESGGFYCIEDLHTSSSLTYSPAGQPTCVRWLQHRLRALHAHGKATACREPIDNHIEQIHCYPKLAMLVTP